MLKIALVGCGFMGKMHSNVYAILPDATMSGFFDKDSQRSSAFANQFGGKAYGSFAEVLADPDVDAVDICLPTYLHREFTVEAAQAGKHVMCEKPMALTLEDADKMTAACEANGVRLMIGHCIRFWPEYALLKKLIDEKTYGDLLSINLTRFGEFPSWSSDNWLADPSKAGGGVLDMHIHDTDYIHYILGEPDETASFGTIDARGPSHAFTTMRFGKTVAHIEGGWNLPIHTPFKMAFRAIFERGAVIMDGGPMTIYADNSEPIVPEMPKMSAAGGGNISDLGGYYKELEYFVSRVIAGEPLEVVTPSSSRQSLSTVLQEIESMRANS